jgi:uncharacterized protein (DUF3084 family)
MSEEEKEEFEDIKNNCSSNKTEINTLKRQFEEVVERTSIRREELREHRQEQENVRLLYSLSKRRTFPLLFPCVSR